MIKNTNSTFDTPFNSALDSCMVVTASWYRTSPHQGHKGQGEDAGSPDTVIGPQTLLPPRHLPPTLDVIVGFQIPYWGRRRPNTPDSYRTREHHM